MSTPHINAKKEDIAPVVLMPGDPLRAKWIAETFLTDVKVVNDVRNMLGFTGKYKDKTLTIMGSGMGIPSIGIYSYELFNFYDVKTIIRIGSAGSIDTKIKIGQVLIAKDAYSYSHYANEIGISATNNTLHATPSLVDLAITTARELHIPFHIGQVYSEDAFYSNNSLEDLPKISNSSQMLEMEAFGLYANAIRSNKSSLAILTCSDSLITKESLNAEDRQTSFKDMAKLALETAIKLL